MKCVKFFRSLDLGREQEQINLLVQLYRNINAAYLEPRDSSKGNIHHLQKFW